jgi:hypothetical protein
MQIWVGMVNGHSENSEIWASQVVMRENC